jgi:phi LC3 family holin
MKINWKVRFKNKTFLASFAALLVTFVYNILALFDVTAQIQQNDIMQMITILLTVLAGLGVIVDPTTAGIEDSNRAMTYEKPNDDANG